MRFPLVTTSYAGCDAANRMTSYNGYPLAYDENGNLTQRQTAQGPVNYTWDARNRLSRIEGPNGSGDGVSSHIPTQKCLNVRTDPRSTSRRNAGYPGQTACLLRLRCVRRRW